MNERGILVRKMIEIGIVVKRIGIMTKEMILEIIIGNKN